MASGWLEDHPKTAEEAALRARRSLRGAMMVLAILFVGYTLGALLLHADLVILLGPGSAYVAYKACEALVYREAYHRLGTRGP